MVQYSVKKSRGRKIKKYRKSRRGKGRGKRSLKGGKTRRYKVFKNAKNHTLGKRKGRGRGRRMMRGGELIRVSPYDYSVTTRLIDYINNKYNDKILEHLKGRLIVLTFKAAIKGYITNISKRSFFRTENKLERIIIYHCVSGIREAQKVYALVRVPADRDNLLINERSTDPLVDMHSKILFVIPNMSGFNAIGVDTDGKSSTELTFKSFISSTGDNYKIILQRISQELFDLLRPPPLEDGPLEDGDNDTISPRVDTREMVSVLS